MPRRAGYGRRVEQAMGDLLAMFRAKRIGTPPSATDPMPVAIAARLALLAGAPDTGVLTGEVSRGTADQQKARRELLAKAAVADAPALLAPLAVPVRCGGRLHTVKLREDDSLWLPNHPGLDPDAERTAAAFGAPLLPCVRELDGAGSSWPPPVADDGPRLEPISVGELLAFAVTCRSWLRRGYSLAQFASAVEQGIAYGTVDRHLQVGFSLEQAVEWAFIPAPDALAWAALGFHADDTRVWLSQGRSLHDAQAVIATADEGRCLARWARVAGWSLDARALAEWAAIGLPVGVWGEVASRGVRACDAQRWLAAGFKSVEVLRYAHLRVTIDEALRWRVQGFTGFAAAGFLGVGMTLQDACALRGLPTREVQDAWRTVRSVDGVRSMVSP